MNYYEHHIGDYDEATAHLTACEDGIYSRLIRKYMATEKPLPAEVKVVQRLVRARAKDEKEAVETILQEFFELLEDGWHQKRCDETIARYLDKQRKARASAEARWSGHRSQSDGNANAYPDAMRTHSEGNANQAPSTSNQTPNLKTVGTATGIGEGSLSGSNDSLTPPQVSSALIGWERERNKAARGITASNQQVIELAAMHVTHDELRRAYDGAVADRRATDDPNPINAGFIRTFVEKYRRPAVVRQTQANPRDERRRAGWEALTGSNASSAQPETFPAEVINGHAKLIG